MCKRCWNLINRKRKDRRVGLLVWAASDWPKAIGKPRCRIFCKPYEFSTIIMTKSLALEAIAGIAHCLAKSNDLSRALALLYFVKNHPSTSYEVLHPTDKLLVDLAANVLPEVVKAAEQRAQSMKLEDVAAELES